MTYPKAGTLTYSVLRVTALHPSTTEAELQELFPEDAALIPEVLLQSEAVWLDGKWCMTEELRHYLVPKLKQSKVPMPDKGVLSQPIAMAGMVSHRAGSLDYLLYPSLLGGVRTLPGKR